MNIIMWIKSNNKLNEPSVSSLWTIKSAHFFRSVATNPSEPSFLCAENGIFRFFIRLLWFFQNCGTNVRNKNIVSNSAQWKRSRDSFNRVRWDRWKKESTKTWEYRSTSMKSWFQKRLTKGSVATFAEEIRRFHPNIVKIIRFNIENCVVWSGLRKKDHVF